MDSKTRAQLRSLASALDPVAQIGKEGLTPSGLDGVKDALRARELIKVNVLRSVEDDLDELAQELADSFGAQVVCVIGSKIVIYKKSDKEGVRHVLGSTRTIDPKRKPNTAKKTNFAGEHNEREIIFNAPVKKTTASATEGNKPYAQPKYTKFGGGKNVAGAKFKTRPKPNTVRTRPKQP